MSRPTKLEILLTPDQLAEFQRMAIDPRQTGKTITAWAHDLGHDVSLRGVGRTAQKFRSRKFGTAALEAALPYVLDKRLNEQLREYIKRFALMAKPFGPPDSDAS